jgi:transcriptional regulator with XRE-family HTH domain
MKTFAQLLYEYRESRRMNQKELARRAGLTDGYISLLINGKRKKPSIGVVKTLASVLELSNEEAAILYDSVGYIVGEHETYVARVSADVLRGDPFIVGPPITHPAKFFGRDRELRMIFNVLRHPPLQHVAIVGPKRSGKTSLLYYLQTIPYTSFNALRSEQRIEWLLHPETYKWVLVDFQNVRMRKRESLLRYVLSKAGMPVPEPCTLDKFIEVFEDNIADNRIIIMMDGIGGVLSPSSELDQDFWDTMRSLATMSYGNLGFIVSSHEVPIELAQEQGLTSPFFNIFGHTIKLGPLLPTEAQKLISSSPRPFSDEDIEWILETSGRWPSLLQFLCDARLQSLQNGETDEEWKRIGYERIERFLDLRDSDHDTSAA